MLVEPAMPYPIYMFHREAHAPLASLRLVAMSGHPRAVAQSLADFVAQLAGRPCCALTTLYGFVLTDDNGRRAVYVGADASGCRPGSYLDALCVDLAAASPDVAAATVATVSADAAAAIAAATVTAYAASAAAR